MRAPKGGRQQKIHYSAEPPNEESRRQPCGQVRGLLQNIKSNDPIFPPFCRRSFRCASKKFFEESGQKIILGQHEHERNSGCTTY